MIWQFLFHPELFFLLPSIVVAPATCAHCDEEHGWLIGIDWLVWGVRIVFPDDHNREARP